MSGFTIFLIIVAAVLLYGVALYNKLIGLRNRVKNSFAQIDVQLTRRHDLIPNLVEAVKGYMKHEKSTLEEVIRARNEAVNGLKAASADPSDAEAMAVLSGAEQTLSGALGRMFMLAEAYPELKANENMLALQEELSSTENKVAFARQAFNDAVMGYNNGIEMFPGSLIAGWFHFKPSSFLEIESEQKREVPEVKF